MRRCIAAAVLVAVGMSLSACSPSMEVENQAYVLVMGIDRTEDGEIELTIRIPKIGQSESSNGGGKDEASPYLTYAVRAGSYARAIDALQVMVPRELNLSHIKLIIASERIAGRSDFRELVDQIAETPHLYNTARVIVCEGSAGDYAKRMDSVIGTRLSAEIDAWFDHCIQQGFIPDSCFADVYYASNSLYSDPTASWGFMDSGEADRAASLNLDSSMRRDAVMESPSQLFLSGAAVFRGGTLALRLDTGETQLLNLALNQTRSISVALAGKSYELTRAHRSKKSVSSEKNNPRVELEISLTCEDQITNGQASAIEAALTDSLLALVRKCQSSKVDPFGFAELAAGRFLTTGEWIDYDWRSRFAHAKPRIVVHAKSPAVP